MDANPAIDVSRIRLLVRTTLPEGVAESGPIFGEGAPVDSLGLVNFLADMEHRIHKEFGREVVLASEKAMSRASSPFRDVSSLTDYIAELLGASTCSA
jgi:hypothetical protein